MAVLPVPPLAPVAVASLGGSVRVDLASERWNSEPNLSFAELWGAGERGAVLSLERELARDQFGPALEAAHAVVQRELEHMRTRLSDGGEPPQGPFSVCQALRVDTRRYLRMRMRLEAWRKGGRIPGRRDALEAYLLAVEVRLATTELERELSDLERA